MVISYQDILKKIDEEFTGYYKPFSTFKNSGILWDECISCVKNQELMNHLVFCNDKLEIPPVKVFLAVNKQFNNLTDMEKKACGAFFGFVFKVVFGYRNQRSIAVNINGVKTATYFYENKSVIKVI